MTLIDWAEVVLRWSLVMILIILFRNTCRDYEAALAARDLVKMFDAAVWGALILWCAGVPWGGRNDR